MSGELISGPGMLYDLFNDGMDYTAYADFAESLFRRNGIKPGIILDMGCGTGNLTAEMGRRGYDMIGADISPEMLACASQKYGSRGILWLCQDMRRLDLFGSVDAVLSSCDCINYLTGDGDLDACFGRVWNFLAPGGLFIFDVNSLHKYTGYYDGLNMFAERAGSYLMMESNFDVYSRMCEHSITFFYPASGGLYARLHEVQLQRYYNAETIKNLLISAGFGRVEIFSRMDLLPGDGEKAERWYFSAVKV